MPRTPTPFDPAAAKIVLDALMDGRTLTAACHLPGAPSWHLVNRWRSQVEGFDWQVRMASERDIPGATVGMALTLAESKARVAAGRPPMTWEQARPLIENRDRQGRYGAPAEMVAAPVSPLVEIDPSNPETCF